MPWASRPLRFRNRPVSPSAYALRPRPVHVAQPFGAAVGAGLEREVALAQQPLVQVDAAAERGEAVIGDDHQHVAVTQLLAHPAHERVVVRVQLPDGVAMRGLVAAPGCRMTRVDVAPEHVLDAIGGVEDADQAAAVEPIERGEEHLLALAVDVVGLLQERPIVGHALVERPGVLGQAERRVGPHLLGEVRRVVRRMRDGHRRRLGIEVDGRHVEREVVAQLGDEQACESLHRHARRGREAERHPVAELAGRQRPRWSRRPRRRARLAARSSRMASGRVSGGLPSRNVFSGPWRVVSMRSPSIATS